MQVYQDKVKIAKIYLFSYYNHKENLKFPLTKGVEGVYWEMR